MVSSLLRFLLIHKSIGVKEVFLLANCKKFTKAATGHMFAHFERAKDENGEYVKFGNENIDTSKSHLNYNLSLKDCSQGEFIKRRCGEVKCLNRKDVNVMCSWVVTMPKSFPVEHEKEFFKNTYDFLEKRYGRDNVVSAYVHLDEVTPHIHFAFVPVVRDKKKGHLKVSAKECVSKFDLQSFHPDLANHLESCFDFEVKMLNDSTKDGNRSIEELKRGSAIKKLDEVSEKRLEAIKTFNLVSNDTNILIKKKERLEAKLDTLEGKFDLVSASSEKADKIEAKKSLIGDKVSISESDFKTLKSNSIKLSKVEFDNILKDEELERLRILIDQEKNLSSSYWKELRVLREDQEYLKTLRRLNPRIDDEVDVAKELRRKEIKQEEQYEIETKRQGYGRGM